MAIEEDSTEQASNSRREMLKALRAAREYSSMPDEDPVRNENKAEDSVDDHGEMKVMAVEEESIEHAAATRREMLRSLRMAKELSSTPDEGTMQSVNNAEDSEETDDKGLRMKFRNYLPHDEKLQVGKLAPTVLPKFEDPVAAAPPPSDTLEDPFVNIAPKKPNWDLRRDVQKKLDKLERRTQKALYQLMQEQEKEREAMDADNGASKD